MKANWERFTRQVRVDSSGSGVVKDLFCGERFIASLEDPDWGPTIQPLLLRAMELHDRFLSNHLSVPEIYPGRPLFVGDGAPRETELPGHPRYWLIPFIPLAAYSGSPLRRCVAKALSADPVGCASYMNVRLLGPPPDDDSEVRELVRSIIIAAKPKGIVALGGDAANQLARVIPEESFGRAPHPRWALVFKRWGEHRYGDHLVRQINAPRPGFTK